MSNFCPVTDCPDNQKNLSECIRSQFDAEKCDRRKKAMAEQDIGECNCATNPSGKCIYPKSEFNRLADLSVQDRANNPQPCTTCNFGIEAQEIWSGGGDLDVTDDMTHPKWKLYTLLLEIEDKDKSLEPYTKLASEINKTGAIKGWTHVGNKYVYIIHYRGSIDALMPYLKDLKASVIDLRLFSDIIIGKE